MTDTKLSPQVAAKRDRLMDLLKSYGSCAVAFSGGLDSTVLAKAARLALGEKAVAVTGVSVSLAAGELEECSQLAQDVGIRHEVLQTGEMSNPEYRKNDANRCYHCKRELFLQVEELSRRLEVAVGCDGSNHDGRSEHRPGMRAAREGQGLSPLAECGFTKAEIRELAAWWEIPIWDKPATPCLSSRIAYGEEVTAERLAMIDRAERFLREKGFQPLRVRYHKGDLARIEVDATTISRFLDPDFREEVVSELLAAGFKYVTLDLIGFRSGSLNAVLASESLQILDLEAR